AAVLAGTVRDQNGQPVGGASVTLSLPQRADDTELVAGTPLADLPAPALALDAQALAHAAKDGAYRIPGILPRRTRHVRSVWAEGFESAQIDLGVFAPGEERALDVTLQTGMAVFGDFTLNGEPATGIVSWRAASGGGSVQVKDGRYRVESVGARTFTLT